ncbi:hypothetical protein [Bradyrhizobium japonicum]|uniref:hypothetical protein n=1 Tax=Bradyrhizobium japonicum TaxID=375 RepID=UPI001BA73FBD|nr:hypothetical protein [Bradyrhizobium japonicum]MBR0916509.1 hypothetical protein [Bradyrhizobium japonicum]
MKLATKRDAVQLSVTELFQRHVTTINDLRGLLIQPINQLVNASKIALLRLVEQLVRHPAQCQGSAPEHHPERVVALLEVVTSVCEDRLVIAPE